MPQHLEDAEQIALLQWAAFTRIKADAGSHVMLSDVMIAIPNGAHLAGDEHQRAMQMGRMKKLGLKPGVADLLIALPRGWWHGLWVEMKRPRRAFSGPAAIANAASDEQKAFGAMMQRVGYRHIVAFGFEEARAAIEGYLDARDERPIMEVRV